ncbi:hypothetical protein OB905_10910 [Halobacteria archaeon AArc-dxtr1]|nr:hypothetical protein [Halobacteria archaeon AArc-dxtr1]
MATHYAKRSLKILRQEGVIELLNKSNQFIIHRIFYRLIYNLKYPGRRRIPSEPLLVQPENINHHIGSSCIPDDALPYGILDGGWDLNKSHYVEGHFYGLFERFNEGKDWEDTVYYQSGIRVLESGGELGRLDGPQTVSNFEDYLNELDIIYEDIKSNGYNMNSTITASISRDGEWMVHQGNHRSVMAEIADVEEIPIKIKYRHKQWQELRAEIYNNGLSEEHTELRDHPDLQDLHE